LPRYKTYPPRALSGRSVSVTTTLSILALCALSLALTCAEARAQGVDDFNPVLSSGYEYVHAIAVQPDGKILIGGQFNTVNGESRPKLARLNPDGTLDTSFSVPFYNPAWNHHVGAIAVRPDGKIIIQGGFEFRNSTGSAFLAVNVALLNSNGSLDGSFNAPEFMQFGVAGVSGLALQADGKVLVGSWDYNNGDYRYFFRLNSNGSADSTFNHNFNLGGGVTAILQQPDGRILVGGSFSKQSTGPRNNIARLNADGSLDTTFNADAGYNVMTLALQPDGKVMVGGSFTQVNGQDRRGIARLNADGTLDAAFDPVFTGSSVDIRAITVQADGKILVGGYFGAVDGQERQGLARLNSDGSLDMSFPDLVVTPAVYAITLQADKKILVGGYFGAVNWQPRTSIARLHPVPTARLAFSARSYAVAESGGAATITVTRTAGTVGEVSVAYATSDGTARSDSDYLPSSGVVTFADGEGGSKTFAVGVTDDEAFEPDETVRLTLSEPTGGAALGSISVATLTIDDDEPPQYPVSGRVLLGSAGVNGVAVQLKSAAGALLATSTTATTASGAGSYSFPSVPGGQNYTVSPAPGPVYTFTPASKSYTNLSAAQAGQNFAATRKTYAVSGRVLSGTAGLNGVTVQLRNGAGSVIATATTAASASGVAGYYSFPAAPAGLDYTVTPVPGPVYSFTPATRSYTNLSANQSAQNFAAARKTYTVSGRVLLGAAGLNGVTVQLRNSSGAVIRSAVTATSASGAVGSYSFAGVPAGYAYTVTPAPSAVYTFTPATRSYASLTAAQANQNFAAARKTYSVSGRVAKAGTTTGVGGVTMTLRNGSGVVVKTATTLADGTYSMTGVPAGVNYVLTPAKAGMTFTPTSKSYTNLSASQAAQNFSGT
jgi:uncharacterized delta-60 repeat protein